MRFLLLLLVPLLVAAAPQPPAVLATYISDGKFDPGDYLWLRGRFAGASAAEQTADREIRDWRQSCHAADIAEARAELTALGVTPGASLDAMPARSLLCAQVMAMPVPPPASDWEEFTRNIAVVRPIAQAYLAAVANAERTLNPERADLSEALNAHIVAEQMLRAGITWARGAKLDSPTLTEPQRQLLTSLIGNALVLRDHANTEWLKRIVAEQGWPRRSQVGDEAMQNAWLLVQHADADPAFQLQALRLIEPLLQSGEATRRNYAYLYDRIMLKISGRQRYATQMTCEGGNRVPRPLEDEKAIDALRGEMGLGSLAEYQALMMRSYGPCPAADKLAPR